MTTVGYLDKEKAANLLGICTETLQMWMRDRRIAYYRIGHRVLFRDADIEAFVATCRVEAKPKAKPTPQLGRRRVTQKTPEPEPLEAPRREPHGPPPPEPEEPEEEGGSEEDDPLAALG